MKCTVFNYQGLFLFGFRRQINSAFSFLIKLIIRDGSDYSESSLSLPSYYGTFHFYATFTCCLLFVLLSPVVFVLSCLLCLVSLHLFSVFSSAPAGCGRYMSLHDPSLFHLKESSSSSLSSLSSPNNLKGSIDCWGFL